MSEEYAQQQESNSNTFIVGMVGVIISILMAILGWEAWYMVAGVIMIGALLYDTDFFAVGIIGVVALTLFAGIGWFPMFMYWTIILVLALVVAAKIVMYFYEGKAK